ncbi:MAG TPA: gluconate 2-dehydrogenase subunit 3 family protein [Nocardioidaceae bacterium]|jgi:hypothetical protein|nr:gluconate 2-dehydrogenase subunit 3 family protein [Nocardioidaceae bacterium]
MRARLPRSGTTPGGHQPRFEGFDVLSQADAWDPVTAGVVLRRVGPPPPIRYFSPTEEATARALLDLILDQHEEPRIPVLEMVDARLAELQTDGWHYADLPPDPEAWSQTLAALDQDAHHTHGRGFAECDRDQQAGMLQAVLDLGSEIWHGMRAERVWSLWYRYACAAFYAHPWAWNEIGFPGPAYPRGYKNAGINTLEPFEQPDQRPIDPVEHPGDQPLDQAGDHHNDHQDEEAGR